jgi:predicted anti-sigma-YlaC factor YlaD
MMPCEHINEKLDDYMDGTLDETEVAMFQSHTESCDSCQQTLKSAQRLRGLLKDCPVPMPDAAYFDQALAKATRVSTNHQRNRWIMTGFGGALAAGLVAWIIGGMLLKTPGLPDSDASIPGVAMSLEVPRTVNLVFSSATKLDNALLTVSLPQGVEIEGFAGHQEITWTTSLKAGKNILPLTLIATTPHGGELLATLEHDDRDRTFRIRVTVT